MVKINVGKHNFYLDGYLKDNLEKIKIIIKKDWDFVFVIDGMEGGGKSTFAIQMALFLDPTLNLDRIVFESDEFEKAVLKADKYQAIIYDEAITGLYSREAMKYINTTLTKLLAQIRQKNLFIFIILPSFFDLDSYVSMWRSRGLFHIYTKDFERGYFAFYDYDTKKQLFSLGKKHYNYYSKKPNIKGRYTKYNPFEKDYRIKKLDSIKKRTNLQINPMYQRDRLIIALYSELGITQKQIAKWAGISQQSVAFVCSKNQVKKANKPTN